MTDSSLPDSLSSSFQAIKPYLFIQSGLLVGFFLVGFFLPVPGKAELLEGARSWTVESAILDNLAISPPSLPNAIVGQPYSSNLSATGGASPLTWNVGNPPSPIPGAPYATSSAISTMTWDFANEEQDGTGSDRWPHTWGADNNVWALWSDGGGMDGTNTACRTRVGTGYITDDPPGDPTFVDVQGCKSNGSGCIGSFTHDAACDAPNANVADGWAEALLSVDGNLYRILALQDNSVYRHSLLQTSTDNGVTWSDTVAWDNNVGTFRPMEFVQYGMDYAGSLDNNIYMFGPANATSPTNSNAYDLYLARVDKSQIDNTFAYEYYTSTDPDSPTWGTWANKQPFMTDDTNGLGMMAISYNSPLSRYIASGVHGPFNECGTAQDPWKCWGSPKNLSVYESETPWGPWKTIVYTSSWHGFTGGEGWGLKFLHPTKWISSDGLDMWTVWSGYGGYDSYNRVKSTMTLYSGGEALPPGMSVDSSGAIVGTPTTAGTYTFTVSVTDSNGATATDNNVSLTVLPAAPAGKTTSNLKVSLIPASIADPRVRITQRRTFSKRVLD